MFVPLILAAALGQTDAPAVRFQTEGNGSRVKVVARLPADLAKSLPAGKCTQDEGETVLRFARLLNDKPGPPLLGSYERNDRDLLFRPRLDLDPGAAFRATLVLKDGTTLVQDYKVPARIDGQAAQVIKIYPSSEVLPANHLKFYIYFSRPMRGGQDLFKLIKLVDADGKEIADSWLTEELWDETTNCLILYIHPGRIKWGVLLRELLGPVLVPNRDYRLVIPADLLDDRGQKLGKDHVKKFRTVAEDRKAINVGAWTVTAPMVKSLDSLTIALGKPVDHRGLQKWVQIVDAAGKEVKGMIAVGKDEKSWSFTPAAAWQPGAYEVRVDRRLEDTSGNSPTRPFDLDLTNPPPANPRLTLPFQVK